MRPQDQPHEVKTWGITHSLLKSFKLFRHFWRTLSIDIFHLVNLTNFSRVNVAINVAHVLECWTFWTLFIFISYPHTRLHSHLSRSHCDNIAIVIVLYTPRSLSNNWYSKEQPQGYHPGTLQPVTVTAWYILCFRGNWWGGLVSWSRMITEGIIRRRRG